jgi:hypothetical protein
MSGNGACASITYRGFVLRKYFRTHNRMGAGWYLLPQLSHHCNFEETVRMNLRIAARAVTGRAVPTPSTPATRVCSHAGSNTECVLCEQARVQQSA